MYRVRDGRTLVLEILNDLGDFLGTESDMLNVKNKSLFSVRVLMPIYSAAIIYSYPSLKLYWATGYPEFSQSFIRQRTIVFCNSELPDKGPQKAHNV
jgi:hypothetical protein